MGELVVSSIVFSEAGAEITFMRVPEDVRDNATLVLQRTLMVAYASPVGSDLTTLREAVEEFTDDALDAYQEGIPVQPEDALDDDDAGMGS